MGNNIMEQLELFNQQIKELSGVYREAISDSGMSENEFWIWYSLMIFEGDYTQHDICNMWFLPKQTVNTIITGMVKKGYIELEIIPGTKNKKCIRITDLGKEYMEKIVMPIFSAEQRAFSRLPMEDRVIFFRTIRKYIDYLKEEIN